MRQQDAALSASFSKLKRDLTAQAESIDCLKLGIAELQKQLSSLSKMLCKISGIRSPNQISAELLRKSPMTQPQQKANLCNTLNTTDLSPLHVEMLKHLMILQTESGKRYVSMRDLASELYPHKQYSIIKATLSEYIKRLHQKGFVEKIHKGRLFLSYTEKALQFADDQRLKRMRELISKPDVR
jgi:hypothetical protein